MAEQMWGSVEVAEYLNLHRQTVTRLADKGELPGVKIGRKWRFRPEDIQAYLDNQIQGGVSVRIPTVTELIKMGPDAGKVLDAIQTDLETVAAVAVNEDGRKSARAALRRLEGQRQAWVELR